MANDNRLRNDAVSRYAVFTTGARQTPLLCPASGKVSFRSSSAAKHFMAEQFKSRAGVAVESVYACRDCPYFHTTTNVDFDLAPEHARAHSMLVERLEDGEAVLTDREARHMQAVRAADAVIAADRWVRMQRDATANIDDMRHRWCLRLRHVDGVHREQAERAVDEMIPLALTSETWGWLVDGRARLLDAIDAATERGETATLAPALAAYFSLAEEHFCSQGLDRASAYRSEFVMISDATSDWFEYTVFAEASEQAMDALFEIEDRSVRR